MEILNKFKQDGYFTAELYHLLARKNLADSSQEIIPSEYLKEMRMNTSERLQHLNSVIIDNIVPCGKKTNKIVLSFSPRIIVFQNFKPNEKIVAKFSVKNISKAPTFLNMVFKESSYFFIKPCGGQLLSRLAPGISVTFDVTFLPVQYGDMIHRVTFYTDEDEYILPLIAMGPRPVFDFPDHVAISEIPLKVENYKTMVIRNVGMVPAGFTLSTKCPFSVQPKSAYLNPQQNIDIRIGFKTMRLGDSRGTIYAIFETGEKFRINVSGSTHIVSIEMEKQIVRFLDTYNTMVRQQTYKITNKSSHLLTYMCMKNESVYKDFEDKVKLATIFYNVKENESAKYTKLVQYDVLSSEEHERVYTRIFYDEIQALVADESLFFHNTHFSISPIKGKLWPNKSTELTITFSPKEIGDFDAIAYLDVDGVADRLPLKMIGTSMAPAINLNLETLDMDRVYINKIYNYEIVAINKGHINGVITYKDVPTLFGSRITCTPEILCLKPGDKEVFVISFCNSNQGPYFEEINFLIRDTDVILKLYLKGEVIYPSLMFSVPCLDFGILSLGMPKTMEVYVINESVIHVNASLKITADGPEVSSITLEDYAVAERPKPAVPQWPREFEIEPSKINIEPESRLLLKVTLTANLVRANQTSLEMELEKSDSPPIILPITFNAVVPQVKQAPDIKLRVCFLDYPYQYEIYFDSDDQWGYFTIEEPEEDCSLQIEVKVKEGLIKPNSTTCLPVVIKTNVLGPQEYPIMMRLFGLSQPIKICHVMVCGVRPIVTCTPMALHWGQVKILQRSLKTLTLCNDSPVVVNYKASLLNRDGRWHIQPAEGFIKPEAETDLTVTLYLIDASTYTNKALIQLEKVKDIMVPLSATGIGTSIIVGELRDRIELGRHFTKIPLNCKVMMENCGTRLHALEWSEHYKQPKTKPHTTSFFNLEPKVIKMSAGEKLELTVTGISYKVTTIKEMWYLVGSIEGVNKKELLLQCEIVAEFVDPKLELSATSIDFQYDFGPYSEYYKLTDIVTIKNISKLPLDMDISVKPPFAIIQKQNTYKISPEEENLCCCIRYNESDINIQRLINQIGQRDSQIFVDYLTMQPVEPLRKGSLNFFQDIRKIKMAFNLTNSIEERLEDEDVMKIQLLFDTTKHTTLKSKVYVDVLRIKCKGHKNKDAIKVMGKINFPNILILSPRLDFQCVLNSTVQSKTIQIQNITPLQVCYKFQWKKGIITSLLESDTLDVDMNYGTITGVKNLMEEISPGANVLHEILSSRTPTESIPEKNRELDQALSTAEPDVIESMQSIDSKIEFELTKRRITQKITPMIKYENEQVFEWENKFPKVVKYKQIHLNEVLQLCPHRGILKANEVQYIHVIFRPERNIHVKAILECEVLGGPTESIMVTGQSSDLKYKLNMQKINFKIRSFHENAKEILIISNPALLPFKYKTYLNEPKFENELQGTILNIVPPEKVLDSEEDCEIQVVMRPGVVGYFKRVFLLEISHLPHIPIEVFGWGVIPQVYLAMQKRDPDSFLGELGYLAIAPLTTEYLEAVNEIFARRTSEHLNTPLTEKCFEDPDFHNDWHICSAWDGYPSIMDIELAIERYLVEQHIKLRPDILTQYSSGSKMGPIPGFRTTPCVIDFGVIITGSTVQTSMDVINYGPTPTKLFFAKGTNVPSWLVLKLCGRLDPGESGKLEVAFSPTSDIFTKLEENVEAYFNLEVPYGVTIPLIVHALCAVPYLISSVPCIDFGSVRCGDKVICSIPLKNVGKPTCIWFVTLKIKVAGVNPMTVLDSSGRYEPGEGGWLSVAFKPNMEMNYEGLLIFRYHMNPNRMTIPIKGQGIIPRVHIIGPNITFPPTLPWSEKSDIFLGLTNPCPFPIELIIAHTDKNWKEEDEIYQLLYKYYNRPEEMLVAAIKPGCAIPNQIKEFFNTFCDRVERNIAEEAVAAKFTNGTTKSARKSKSPKSLSKSMSTMPSRKCRTEAEIVADVIQSLREEQVDPLKECLHLLKPSASETGTDKNMKGILIFFHGSPCEEMQCQEIAYSVGKSLGIPTINVDLCIVEALCVSKCTAKEQIITVINEMYEMSCKQASKSNELAENEGEIKYEEEIEDTEDEHTVMWNKIDFLARCKNIGTPRAKAGEKKKAPTTSSVGSHSVLGSSIFQPELIQELLTDFFSHTRFNRGFIVDTLTSIVFKNPSLVLTTIAKCKRTIQNLHLVLCQGDFNKWALSYEDAQRESEVDETVSKVYDETEIAQILYDVENMTEEEYENVSPEIKSVYITYGLKYRRNKYFEKRGDQILNEVIKTTNTKEISKTAIGEVLSENKKKVKKEDPKGGKLTSEYLLMNTKYNEYTKNTYENLINIANNWIPEEYDMGFPIYGFNGQVVGAAQKKTKAKSEITMQASEVALSERGFPLTLIMCPCDHYKDALVWMFKSSKLVQEALKEEEEFEILDCPVKREEFSVLLPKTLPDINHEDSLEWRFFDEKPIKKCECNHLTDLDLLDDSNQDAILNILSKWHCTCGKKVNSSQTSTSEIPSTSVEKVTNEERSDIDLCYPLPLHNVKSILGHEERLVLEPGDLIRCKFTFNPKTEGCFSIKRYIEVTGWPASRIAINASGICDLPRIDSRPKKMFDNFVRRTVDEIIYKHTFLDEQKIFEFGPIFIGQNRIYEEIIKINLKNSSLMTADIEIEFIEDTTVFEIDKAFMKLESGERGNITVSAAPTEVGVHSTVLLFCIKDNPEVVTITIACSGVVPRVEILPLTKSIEYGKLLLYRREDDRFIVKNESILPIMWKIRNPHEFIEDFIISHTSGIVPRQDNQVVPVTFIASKVGVISNKNLIIDVYDGEGRGDPMIVESLSFSAECYDVLVECSYENADDNNLNYGNVKVNSTVSREMYLMNRGKYNIYFKLKKVKKFPEPTILRSMEASQECGIIAPNLKMATILFECTPKVSVNLVNEPAYICSLLDGSKNQVVVAKFPICVTIASFYNTFTLFPLGELNFHIIPVGSGVAREVILNNTSKCPVTYEIILPPAYQLDSGTPLPVPGKGKDNKIKNPPLKCGNFVIANDDNLLAPGTSRIIQIQFFATAAKKFEETIKFIISDTCPAEAQGVPLKLVGVGAMPTLDFWNLETTFREHLIVKNMSEYKVPEASPHCVFVEDSVSLNFFSVTVLTSYTATIDLYNNGLVPCVLNMKLHYQSNVNEKIFALDKYETHIEPLLHKNLGIIFTPKALEEYRAVLEIKLKLLDNQSQTFRICLIGEGNIPRIKMLLPNMKQAKIGVLQLPVTCLGSISNKSIVFRNISSVKSLVIIKIRQQHSEERPVFWLAGTPNTESMVTYGNNDEMNTKLELTMKPNEAATVHVYYNPIRKGRATCDVELTITDNPFENFTILCEAEAFIEDVILLGLEMLSLDAEVESDSNRDMSSRNSVAADSRKKIKSASYEKKKKLKDTKKRKASQASSLKQSDTMSTDSNVLKYLLDFGGCELFSMQRRSVIMVNNSEKVYKFTWLEAQFVVIKPSIGYISPGEEKDLEIMFYSTQPVVMKKEMLNCSLMAISDDSLTMDMKSSMWDNRQSIMMFDHNKELGINERHEDIIDDQILDQADLGLGIINIIILYSAKSEYIKYSCTLSEEIKIPDTFIYQKRKFEFTLKNTGNVPIKISWSFQFDEEFPSRIDRVNNEAPVSSACGNAANDDVIKAATGENKNENDGSKDTLFSGSVGRESVDTWFEIDLPFAIEPTKHCLKPHKSQVFKVTFSPLDAFNYRVRLKSCIDNLDPYDQNISSRIIAKSLIPYCHLDVEESDYLTAGRRKVVGVTLPLNTTVFEFNVLGSGCYKKSFNVINPTSDGYEFIFEMVMSDKPELIPVHCNMLKGYVEGGTSTEVTFTFSPTAPGVYESMWKFVIPVYSMTINVLVVGIVREPEVGFIPTILIIRNSLVGFTTTDVVMIRNPESESLKFQFKGNSLCNESGKTPVIVEPEEGLLKPCSETPIKIIYTPIEDGPLSFKIFCSVTNMTKFITLCVNALSYSIKPKVTYYLLGNEHILNSEAITNIHLDQSASSYERTIPFLIKNDGSATFFFDWRYSCASVKKYLQVSVEPKSGHISPGDEADCTVYFTLKQVPVEAYPMTLSISDGPEYSIYLHSEIEKPLYHFSCKHYDFGKCVINAPDPTYKKNLAFFNDDKVPVTIDLNFSNLPELFVHYHGAEALPPGERLKIGIYFRPKEVKEYEFKLQFWVNSLCEEIITLKGEGVPLLFDLYEGCQKSFDLGPVKVGEKIVKQIEVMNHSKVPIDATFVFREMYPVIADDGTNSEATSICLSPSATTLQPSDDGPSRVRMLQSYKDNKVKEQISKDIQNALSSLKIVPNKCTIKPYRKVPLKIQFKPVGMIGALNVQVNMRVFEFERPLVRLSGSATGMSLSLSQNSLQFGRVRKRGCKVLKVMLINKGDFNARFWWQPLISDEFIIAPQHGTIAAHTNVTFTITFRPKNHNPFIKVWASCNIENYMPLELAMYASCIDLGNVQSQTLYFDCPVRETVTEHVTVTNPSDDVWLVLSEVSGESFETLKEFNVEPNSTFGVPIHFKPKTMGNHEAQVLFSPLGEYALFLTLVGTSSHPNPNGIIQISVTSKEFYVQELKVFHITEVPETYAVNTEIIRVTPEKFDGYYEVKHTDTIMVWGETFATCRWNFVCYGECTMEFKVTFVNVQTREYQFYYITVTVTPSEIVDTVCFVSRARESVQMDLVIVNPLAQTAEFEIISKSLSCPDTIKINKNSKAELTVTFSPLVVGETEELLEAYNSLVGSYFYKMILKCLPAKEKNLEFTASFGTSIPIRLRVQNRTDTKTDFVCTVSHPSILADKEYSLGPGEKGKFLVWFEPTVLGVQNTKVSFNSPIAGEFVFNITGIATEPKPQGPFEIRAGGFTTIKFKNVFDDTKTFKVSVDQKEFYLKTVYEQVKPKRDIKITVYMCERQEWREYPTGCLTIECCDPPEPKIQWTYFLQGVE